jgi:hypothetical protein
LESCTPRSSPQLQVGQIITHGVIEYQHIDFPFEIDADEDDGERSWYRIAYVVELCASDIGAMWAVKQLDRDGFMDQVAPVIPVA